MSSKVWSIRLSKHEKMIKYHVHIRSKDQNKQVGVREKKWQKWDQKFGILTLNLLSLKTNMRVNLKTYVYSRLEYWDTETYKDDWDSCSYQIHRSF